MATMTPLLILGAAVPLLLMGMAVGLGRLRWPAASPRAGASLIALALGLGYLAGHMGLRGGPGLGIEGGLLTVGLVGTLLSMLQVLVRPSRKVQWLVRMTGSLVAAVVILLPLREPQGWSPGLFALNLGLSTLAGLALWTGLERIVAALSEAQAALVLLMLSAGSAGVMVMGGLASAAPLLVPIAAMIGLLFVAALLFPDETVLGALPPILGLTLAAHYSGAVFYAELPLLSLLFVVALPLPILLVRRPVLKWASRKTALAAALGLGALWLTAAAVPAASRYFGTTSDLALPEATPIGVEKVQGPGQGASTAPAWDKEYGYE